MHLSLILCRKLSPLTALSTKYIMPTSLRSLSDEIIFCCVRYWTDVYINVFVTWQMAVRDTTLELGLVYRSGGGVGVCGEAGADNDDQLCVNNSVHFDEKSNILKCDKTDKAGNGIQKEKLTEECDKISAKLLLDDLQDVGNLQELLVSLREGNHDIHCDAIGPKESSSCTPRPAGGAEGGSKDEGCVSGARDQLEGREDSCVGSPRENNEGYNSEIHSEETTGTTPEQIVNVATTTTPPLSPSTTPPPSTTSPPTPPSISLQWSSLHLHHKEASTMSLPLLLWVATSPRSVEMQQTH